ncbi:MAG TPA: hypothetical protein VF771_16340, partial [Longimicrobiaceae bacterium]
TVFAASTFHENIDLGPLQKLLASWSDEERRTLCWCRLVGDRVEVHQVPGSHVSMGREPNVRTLAERVRQSLVAARARTDSAAATGGRVTVPEIFP